MKEEEKDKEIPKLLLEKIQKELESWTEGNKKDIIYLLGHDLFFSKDPIVRAEALR